MREDTVSSVSEYIAVVEELVASQRYWFRGVGSASHTLTPGIYRPPIKDSVEAERYVFEQFSLRSLPYGKVPSPWDRLFLMQHHRLPTRLLDWSENPFVGLYFALESADRSGYSSDAAVWLLDPETWNESTQQGRNPTPLVLTTESERLRFYLPPIDVLSIPNDPVAIYAPHSNGRIVAQSGAFTIFGKEKTPLETIYETKGYPDGCLTKILLPQAACAKMFIRLTRMGYTQSRVFPDLDGLSDELWRHLKASHV